MTKFNMLLLAGALVAPGVIVAAAPAQAQSVAVLDPDAAVANTNAWKTANAALQTQYKTQIDQYKSRSQQLQAQIAPMLKQFDTNNDGKLSQDEIQAAQQTKAAQLKQVEAQQQSANAQLSQMIEPYSRARAYALEQIANHEDEAVGNVVKSHHVAVLLRPEATFVADPSADLTSAVTAELDRLITTPVSTTPPAGWQPGQQQAAPAAAAAPSTGNQQQGR